MNILVQSPEVKTTLVNYRIYKVFVNLSLICYCLLFVGYVISDAQRHRVHPSKVENHLVFKHFSKNKSIVTNYERLRNIGVATFIISIVAAVLFFHFAQQCFNRGFFKVNQIRVNINGDIFQLQDCSSLKFTINSVKVYGKRSAKEGFRNWIEFVANGKEYCHEFYLETWTMEDSLLKLLEEIKAQHVNTEIKIIESKKSWFTKLLEELGIDPQ
jgi:hypothetical protein